MADNLSDIFGNIKNMVDSGNIPDELKTMLGNLGANNSSSSTSTDADSLNSNFSPNNSSSTNSDFNIDIGTIMKMKSIIEAMNKKDDPRANLLYSLKPYMRESRQSKLDQYVNLLNMTKIADFMKNDKKENDNNA